MVEQARPQGVPERVAEAGEEPIVWIGIVFIVLGLAAIVFPHLATLTVEIFVGALLLAGGAVQLYRAVRTHRRGAKLWRGAMGVLWFLAGALFLALPGVGMISIAVAVAILVGADGLLRLAYAARHREDRGRLWVAIGGVVNLVLAALIAVGLPGAAFWVIGLIIGVSLVFDGAALLAARRAGPA